MYKTITVQPSLTRLLHPSIYPFSVAHPWGDVVILLLSRGVFSSSALKWLSRLEKSTLCKLKQITQQILIDSFAADNWGVQRAHLFITLLIILLLVPSSHLDENM